MTIRYLFYVVSIAILSSCSDTTTIWQIGNKDASPHEFALAPEGFTLFLENDFGYEDKFFLINHSETKNDFPYVLPGPADTWGGTWGTAGLRTNEINILFGVKDKIPPGQYRLTIELTDFAKKFLPLVKVSFNGRSLKYQLEAEGYDLKKQNKPTLTEDFVDTTALKGNYANATPLTLEMIITHEDLRPGGNHITIMVLEGAWIMFDQIRLEGPSLKLVKPEQAFIRNVQPADYELQMNGLSFQPLLVDVEHLNGIPELSVYLDGKEIFKENIEEGRYQFEVPMPSVEKNTISNYEVRLGSEIVEKGKVSRNKMERQTFADYVDTRIGSGHSRWMIAPGPWMPFSMVKISPDNQDSGWQAGYQPSFESIGTFSHIHEWTMAGLGIFASNGELKTKTGNELDPSSGYRSTIDKNTEEAPIGYYKAHLLDYDIKAELTATTRCALTRFTFPDNRDSARILVDLQIPAEYDYILKEAYIKKTNDNRIEGYAHQYSQNVWSKDADQDYTLHFVLEFDRPIKRMGYWINGEVSYGDVLSEKDVDDAGAFLEFDTRSTPVVQVRAGISMVSIENAALNLNTELSEPFGWDFEAVRENQKGIWNEYFDRIKIYSSNRLEKIRFYNAVYRSICSRNTWSDVNGEWIGTDGALQKLKDPDHVALGCDAFWNTFWNLNQLWNLAYPEWSSRWVNSQLAMYDAYGWLAKGPAGMNYIPVMVAEHEIPLIVGAYQMGIRDFDAKKALEAAVKMQTTPARKIHNGYAGNRDLKTYLKHGYVPYDKGRFSNTMEYSFDDWTVGQFARALGDNSLYERFNDRGYWWKNVMSDSGYAQMRDSKGTWHENFDPFKSGANHHYVEGNAWQLTFFVPQDVPELVATIGKDRFIDRLEWGFEQSDPWRFNGMNDQYWDYPVVQGNQQSMHFAFLFNWAGKPWSTQKWSRAIMDRYYGYGINNAYLGDEDQGQMSAWFVMSAIGLFQTDGGTSIEPVYELGSPLFEKIEIDLGNQYGRGETFSIIAKNNSRSNKYIQSATLNGKILNSFKFPASELLKGGSLVLEMGKYPNENWGKEAAE
ncbi:MAG: GH92 family glycosyl hydrolase [Cyclobacteriaceae bacterium]|nr:GH92 family glycosyl hydrolase [Cyclobacteriaceae bacterium]